MKALVKVILKNPCGFNMFGTIVGETEKNYIISLQDKKTLERQTRAFSKKTLKCRSNGSKFTSNCEIEKFCTN